MRGLFVILVGLLLFVGCDQRKPSMSGADFAEFRASNPGMTERCLNENRFGGIAAWRPDDPNCFAMLPARPWSGLWEKGWEWTNFCPDPAKECDWMAKRGTWLIFAEGARPKADLPDGTYRIEFIGRRSKVPGNFGHTAAYEHLMVVDRVTSIRKVNE